MRLASRHANRVILVDGDRLAWLAIAPEAGIAAEADQGDGCGEHEEGGANSDGEVIAVHERLRGGLSVGGAERLRDGADVGSRDILRLHPAPTTLAGGWRRSTWPVSWALSRNGAFMNSQDRPVRNGDQPSTSW